MGLPMSTSSIVRYGALALVPFTLAACSSGAATDSSATASASSSAAPPTVDPNAGVITGTRLKALLLPVSVLPKSYTVDKQVTYDSADVFSPPSNGAVEYGSACRNLEATSWIRTAATGSGAFAQADFMDPSQQEFYERIDSFHGTDAQTAMTRLADVFAHCAHFTDTSGNPTASVTIKTTKLPGIGDETIKAVESAPEWQGGTTLVATRVGNEVITTLYNVQSNDLGSGAVPLTEKIIAKVKAAAAK